MNDRERYAMKREYLRKTDNTQQREIESVQASYWALLLHITMIVGTAAWSHAFIDSWTQLLLIAAVYTTGMFTVNWVLGRLWVFGRIQKWLWKKGW